MAITVGSVIARFQSDLTDFKKGITQVKSDVTGFADQISNVGRTMQKVGGVATAALTLPIVGIGTAAVKAAADFEQSTVAFTTMLGSAERAKNLLIEITDFALKTPFQLKDVETGAKQLLAYGVSADNVLTNLKQLGDIAAGVGMDKLPNLILAFGQVKAATRLTGMELRQFTEAGVPLLDELSKVMGKPVQEIQKLVSAGEVGFPIVEQALANLTGEGGRFFNLMEKQSKTTAGQMSNLKDNVDKLFRALGQELLPTVNKIVNALNVLIGKFQNLSEGQRQTIVVVGAILAVLGPLVVVLGTIINSVGLIIGVVQGAAAAFGTAAAAIGVTSIGLIAIIAAIAAVIAIGYLLYKNWDEIKAKAIELFETVSTAITSFYENNVKPILEAVGAVFTWLWETIIKPVIDQIVAYYQFWYDVLSWVWNNLIYPILLLIAAIFLRIFYEIFMHIKTNLEKAWEFWKALFETIWGWVKPWLETFANFVGAIFDWIKEKTNAVWTWIKEVIITRFTEAKDKVIDTANNIYNSVRDKFESAYNTIRDIWQRVKDAIVKPFEEAKRKVEEIAQAIKNAAEKINPFHRESPSLVDNVRRGIEAIKDAYSSIGFGFEPPAVAPAAVGAGTVVNVNMAGANITDMSVAEDYAEAIGDSIIRRLAKVNRT